MKRRLEYIQESNTLVKKYIMEVPKNKCFRHFLQIMAYARILTYAAKTFII